MATWVQGRSELEGVADFLGHPAQLVAAVPPAPGAVAAFAVDGFAVLPPHGHPSASRQCVYVNGVMKFLMRLYDLFRL